MSDGEDETDDAPELDAAALGERLDAVAKALEAAETEADLDAVEADLDDVASDVEAGTFPEPDDEDDEDPGAEVEDRLSTLRDDLEEARGPYAEDVVAAIEDAGSTVTGTRWTEGGESELVAVVDGFLNDVNDVLDTALSTDSEADPEMLGDALDEAADAVREAGLDPDDDEPTIEALLDATDTLAAGVEDAESWDDLSVREQLDAEGYYDVLGTKTKDYPPEWTAIKEWEKRDDAEMVLLVLDKMGDSGFIERHALDALAQMGSADAVDAMEQRAQRRDTAAIKVLGKIGEPAEDALDTILEYAASDGNPALQKATLKAVGEIGSEAATQEVADQLASDNEPVRSHAARALGMIGDTRAVDPLADVAADDPSDAVRASAVWALYQIGTRRALEAASEFDDDPAYLVQVEAERATDALADAPTA